MLRISQIALRTSLVKNPVFRGFCYKPTISFHAHKGGIANSPNPDQVELKFSEEMLQGDQYVETGYGRDWSFEAAEEDMLLGHWEPADWNKVQAINL